MTREQDYGFNWPECWEFVRIGRRGAMTADEIANRIEQDKEAVRNQLRLYFSPVSAGSILRSSAYELTQGFKIKKEKVKGKNLYWAEPVES